MITMMTMNRSDKQVVGRCPGSAACVLEFRDVAYSYLDGNKHIHVLSDTNCSFERGVFYALLGPSGAGKTTALGLAGGLEVPQKGSVLFHGTELREIGMTNYRSKHVSMVFQAYNLLPYMNALQNVVSGMELARSSVKKKTIHALQWLARVGLTEEESRRSISKLSGGQQQRVAIARALACDTELILADEPTGNLDAASAYSVVQLFKEIAHTEGKCVIAVTHSELLAAEADVVVELRNGALHLAAMSASASRSK